MGWQKWHCQNLGTTSQTSLGKLWYHRKYCKNVPQDVAPDGSVGHTGIPTHSALHFLLTTCLIVEAHHWHKQPSVHVPERRKKSWQLYADTLLTKLDTDLGITTLLTCIRTRKSWIRGHNWISGALPLCLYLIMGDAKHVPLSWRSVGMGAPILSPAEALSY